MQRSFFDLISVFHGAQCVLGGDGNYNTHAGLLSCPCGDVFPGASQGDGDGGNAPMKGSRNPPPLQQQKHQAYHSNSKSQDHQGVSRLVSASISEE